MPRWKGEAGLAPCGPCRCSVDVRFVQYRSDDERYGVPFREGASFSFPIAGGCWMRSAFLAIAGGLIILSPGCGSSPIAGENRAAQPQDISGAIAPLPRGTHRLEGRIVTVRLPYRAADNLLWASATGVMEAAPFMFQDLDIQPRAGPQGTDLAVFTYKADKPGTATLEFGLVPVGKTLLGNGTTRFRDEPARRYSATVTAQ